jgi:hypothetical protein
MLVMAFGLMIFVLLLYKFFVQPTPTEGVLRHMTDGEGDPLASLLDELGPLSGPTGDFPEADTPDMMTPITPPRRDRLAEGGPKAMRPLRKALPINNQPLIVIGFRPGEDAIEITLPQEDMAEARRLHLTPDIRPDPRGGCVVTLGGVTVARVHSAVIGQRDVILREEVAA